MNNFQHHYAHTNTYTDDNILNGHFARTPYPEPRATEAQIKHTVRLLKGLVQDLKRKNSKLKHPSTWLLKNLVQTHYCAYRYQDWRASIISTLKHIAIYTDKKNNPQTHRFIDTETGLPLFPNQEDFTIKDTFVFSESIIAYLEEITPH